MFLTSLLLVTAPAATPAVEGIDPYAGALERSIDRCEQRIRNRLTVWTDHSDWSNPWRVRTQFFEVRTSSRYYVGRSVGQTLDAMVSNAQNLLETSFAPAVPMQVMLFPSIDLYNSFAGNAGTRSSILGAYFAEEQPNQPVAVVMNRDIGFVKMWASHASLHKYLQMAFGSVPDTWILEGLGSYYSYWEFQDWAKNELRLAIDRDAYVPISSLVREPIESYTSDPHTRFVQLGMLFTYLLHFREETRMNAPGEEREVPATSFQDFLQLAVRGQDVSSHPFATECLRRADEIEADFRSLDWIQQ